MYRKILNFIIPCSVFGFIFIWLRASYSYFPDILATYLTFFSVAAIALTSGFIILLKNKHIPLLLIFSGLTSLFPLTVTILQQPNEFLYRYLTNIPALFLFFVATIFPPLFALGGALRNSSGNNIFPSVSSLLGSLTGLFFSYIMVMNGNIILATTILAGVNIIIGITGFVAKSETNEDLSTKKILTVPIINRSFLIVFSVFYLYTVYRILLCKFTGFVPVYIIMVSAVTVLFFFGSLIMGKVKSVGINFILIGCSSFLSIFLISYMSGLFSGQASTSTLASILFTYKIFPFIFALMSLLPFFFIAPAIINRKEMKCVHIVNFPNLLVTLFSIIATYYVFPLTGSYKLLVYLAVMAIIIAVKELLLSDFPGLSKLIYSAITIGFTVIIFFVIPDWKAEQIYGNSLHSIPVSKVLSFTEGKQSTVMTVSDRLQRPRIAVNGAISPFLTKRAHLLSGILASLYHPSPSRALSLSYLYPEDIEGLLISPDIESVEVIVPGSEYESTISQTAGFDKFSTYSDERISYTVGSPRFLLHNNKEKNYDIIVNATLEPWAHPDYHYSYEFLSLLKDKVGPKGIVVQRINTLFTSKEQLSRVLYTMKTVFTQISVWSYQTKDLIVLCSNTPIITNYNRMELAPSIKGTALNNALQSVGLYRKNSYHIIDGFRGFDRDILDSNASFSSVTDVNANLDMTLYRKDLSPASLSADEMLDVNTSKLSLYGIFNGKNNILISHLLGLKINLSDNWKIFSAGYEFSSKTDSNEHKVFSAKPYLSLINPANNDKIEVWTIAPGQYKIVEDAIKDYSPGEKIKSGEGSLNGHPLMWYMSEENSKYYLTSSWVCDKKQNTFFVAKCTSNDNNWEDIGKMLTSHIMCYHEEIKPKK